MELLTASQPVFDQLTANRQVGRTFAKLLPENASLLYAENDFQAYGDNSAVTPKAQQEVTDVSLTSIA